MTDKIEMCLKIEAQMIYGHGFAKSGLTLTNMLGLPVLVVTGTMGLVELADEIDSLRYTYGEVLLIHEEKWTVDDDDDEDEMENDNK